MISKKVDCSSLLDELRDISNNYYMNNNGEIINKDGEIVNDEEIISKTKLYILYCMAYKVIDEANKKESIKVIDKAFITRALTSYGMFNYFINVCLGEYRIYDDIGTGMVSYVPYQPLADFFFENDFRKEILLDYLKKKLDVKEDQKKNKGVK